MKNPVRLPRGSYMTHQGQVFEARRLIRLGRSWVLVLPKTWVRLFAPEGWVELEYRPEEQELRVRPLTQDKMEVLHGHRARDR
ncbi:MAG: hypothetical protein WBF66_07300 [Dehalococcoidia bacterium]